MAEERSVDELADEYARAVAAFGVEPSEALVRAYREGHQRGLTSGAVRPNRELMWASVVESLRLAEQTATYSEIARQVFDALLADADLWQPAPEADRDALIDTIEGAWTDDDPEFSGVIADALLASGFRSAPRTVSTVAALDPEKVARWFVARQLGFLAPQANDAVRALAASNAAALIAALPTLGVES